MNPTLIDLPWKTLLVLAGGYAGYYVANIGIRDHHKTIDVAFSTLVFGFFCAFSYEILRHYLGLEIGSASLIAFAASLALGMVWTMAGRRAFAWAIRTTNASHSDDLPNAWVSLFARTDTTATQLAVMLKDGTWLKCDSLHRFKDKPNGPCVLGGSGDLLLYVTHRQKPGEDSFAACEGVCDESWGDEITYIPRDQISRVDIRRKK